MTLTFLVILAVLNLLATVLLALFPIKHTPTIQIGVVPTMESRNLDVRNCNITFHIENVEQERSGLQCRIYFLSTPPQTQCSDSKHTPPQTQCSDSTPPPAASPNTFPFRVIRRRGRPRKAPSPTGEEIKELTGSSGE